MERRATKATLEATSQNGWQVVQRKKRQLHNNTTTSAMANPTTTVQPYLPYTYAQVVAVPPTITANTTPTVSPTPSRPHIPQNPTWKTLLCFPHIAFTNFNSHRWPPTRSGEAEVFVVVVQDIAQSNVETSEGTPAKGHSGSHK